MGYKVKITYFQWNENDYPKEKIEEFIKANGEYLKKDKARSNVKVIETDNRKVVVKEPVDKNRRKWIRFMTLFRNGEARASLESMRILNENGIRTNVPYACIEYIKFGMIFDSYMLYEYIDGKKVEEAEEEDGFNCLNAIHKFGYCHGDVNRANFLNVDNEVVTIDSNLKKRNFIFRNVEKIKFLKMENLDRYIDKDLLSFKIAKYLFLYTKKKKELKNRIKKILRNKI